MKKLISIAVVALILIVVSPVSATERIYPTYEWVKIGAGSEVVGHTIDMIFDSDHATYGQWSNGNGAVVKVTFPNGANVTQVNFSTNYAAQIYILKNPVLEDTYPNVCFSSPTGGAGTWTNKTVPSGFGGECAHGIHNSTYYLWQANMEFYDWEFYGTPPQQTEIDFTGTPLSGPAPTTVTFTIYNFTTIGGVYPGSETTLSYGDGQQDTITTYTANHTYTLPGNYTVILEYYNVSNTYTSVVKTKYITIGSPNATATTYAVARDLYTGYAIQGAHVDMYDIENTSWTNTTTINGEGHITTLVGHTLNLWGSATGYEDDNLQGVAAVDGGYYSLLLKPTNLTTYNTTPGNLTLFVTVQDLQIPHQTLAGAEVTAAWGAQYAAGTSNAAGNVFFTVPNNTAIHLSAFKSGYASGSVTHITGTANGGSTMETTIVYIGTDYVTPIPTVTLTTGPGGTVPQTVDPYPCVGDGSAQDTANCQRKQGSMAAGLISWGPDLMNFFIMLTIVGGMLLLVPRR